MSLLTRSRICFVPNAYPTKSRTPPNMVMVTKTSLLMNICATRHTVSSMIARRRPVTPSIYRRAARAANWGAINIVMKRWPDHICWIS